MHDNDTYGEHKQNQKVTKQSLCWLVIVLIVNGTMVGIGIWGKGECASNPIDIGVWLIVTGVTGIAFILMSFLPKLEAACGCCFGIFGLAWFIVGGVCLFSDGGKALCASTAVWNWALAFWIINAIMITMSVCFICCFFGLAAVLGLVAAKIANSEERENLV
uniref:Uncharacterized protein n=1 Tax=Vannella robusta TaxID=1487602 RepID=A0A7S4MT73_9EUKA|mmetsp:Transcript_9678/g.11974  ORF Transcript_9678/g.11974 Transcript_9678/m.11974 type:complete len:162 (+) Transcript_9678:44-529(+)